MNDVSNRLRTLAWPPTRAYYVHRLHHAVKGLIQQAESFAAGLELLGFSIKDGERHLWNEVYRVQNLLSLSWDIPGRQDTRFRTVWDAEQWLNRIFGETVMTHPRDLPPDSSSHILRLSDPSHLKAYRQILSIIPDPFDGPHGRAVELYEWASHHLDTTPEGWNFHAVIPADFEARWARAQADKDEDDRPTIAPRPVIRERRRHLLAEVGFLRVAPAASLTDALPIQTALQLAPPTASSAPAATNDKAPAADPLRLEDRAMMLLTRWANEGRSGISKRAIAEALGCHHSSLDACRRFVRLWELYKSSPTQGYRDAKTGRLEATDDD